MGEKSSSEAKGAGKGYKQWAVPRQPRNAEGSFFYSHDCSCITEIERLWLGITMGNAALGKKNPKIGFPSPLWFLWCKVKSGCTTFSSTQELLFLHSAWA